MHKRYIAVVGILVLLANFVGQAAFADDVVMTASPSVLISAVQTRDAISSYDEFVVIENNTHTAVDMTGWCVKYVSSSGSTKTLDCFLPDVTNGHYQLPDGGMAVIASTQEAATLPLGTPLDGTFAGTLSNDAGTVQLVDENGITHDSVDWGAAATTGFNGIVPAGQIIERLPATDPNDVLKDTDSLGDFALVPSGGFPSSSLTLVYDLCLNLAGVQTEIPPGDSLDGQGNCSQVVDVCLNIDGLQAELPPGLTLDDAGNCLQDETPPPNDTPLDGTDDTAPGDGSASGDSTDDDANPPPDTSDEAPSIPYVTELLPNPSGDDKGQEFIEIYNPNDTAIDLSQYQLQIGTTLGTNVVIASGTIIAANSYLALYNSVASFTLVNGSGAAGIVGSTASAPYNTAPDAEAWALIDGSWQWTNQPTPGAENAASIVDTVGTSNSASESLSVVPALKPCAANQYRNPSTNRCKLIATTSSGSAPTPCAAGQERNPDTNRCRKIGAATSEPTPCKTNQERNPATNRCKNIVAMPTSTDYKVLGAKTTKDGHAYIWWIVGGVAAAGAGYAVWEWHEEIGRSARWVWQHAKRQLGK